MLMMASGSRVSFGSPVNNNQTAATRHLSTRLDSIHHEFDIQKNQKLQSSRRVTDMRGFNQSGQTVIQAEASARLHESGSPKIVKESAIKECTSDKAPESDRQEQRRVTSSAMPRASRFAQLNSIVGKFI
ncbi:hypothetical protein FGO68_gene13869 [Halteria grandinella]|uniref:Uncharacterized protein n=1 Tax=Halteria grandinella TaxID=5974 RepID=A0A8J8SVS8_HALGN|nr:hypothetical protein FGO68_gene13869 [Halteria grandinella]